MGWNVVRDIPYRTHLDTVGVYLATLPKDTATVITIAHWFLEEEVSSRNFTCRTHSSTLHSVPGPAGHILHPLFYIQDSPHSLIHFSIRPLHCLIKLSLH